MILLELVQIGRETTTTTTTHKSNTQKQQARDKQRNATSHSIPSNLFLLKETAKTSKHQSTIKY
jgi:hypothetical protein